MAKKTAAQVDSGATGTAALHNKFMEVFDDVVGDGTAEPAPAPAPAPEAPAEPAAPAAEPAPADPGVTPEVTPEADDYQSAIPSDVMAPPAAEPDADPEPPASVAKDAKANEAWKSIRADLKKAKEDARNAQAEIERLRAQPQPEVSEVLQYKKQIEEYEAKLGQHDLASTKAFQQRYDAPMTSLINKGVHLLVRSGKDADEAKVLVRKLLDPNTSMEQSQELLADQPFALQGAIMSLTSEFQDLSDQRQEALQHWNETKAAMGEQETRNTEIKLVEDIEKNTSEAVQQALKEGNWMFAMSNNNPEWNDAVGKRVQAVKGIIRTAKPAELVKWVIEGVTAKPLRDLLKQTDDKARSLKAELDKLVKVSPRLAAGAPSRAPADRSGKPRTPSEVIDSVFG